MVSECLFVIACGMGNRGGPVSGFGRLDWFGCVLHDMSVTVWGRRCVLGMVEQSCGAWSVCCLGR